MLFIPAHGNKISEFIIPYDSSTAAKIYMASNEGSYNKCEYLFKKN
jgi:hypothetical protein